MNRWRDWHFGAALAAAPLLVLAVLLLAPDRVSVLSWPLRQPRRFLGLVLLWPIMEEVVFRGWLQPALLQTNWGGRGKIGVTLANLLTSLIFAAAHLFYHLPVWALLVIFPSLLFGYFRDRHDSLLTPIVLHVSYNLAYYWVFWL